jgi:uncharacterized protein (DUF362 family)
MATGASIPPFAAVAGSASRLAHGGGGDAYVPPGKVNGSTVHAVGVPRGAPRSVLELAIRKAMLDSMDLSRVKYGDKVLLIPALNSDEPYPATVHPLAVSVMVDVLREAGADVTVACLSGIEYVLQAMEGVSKGTSLGCATKSGMLSPGIKFVGCEDLGWEDGFTLFKDPRATHWPDGFHITRLVAEADHVVMASRLSTHGMAGVTLGIKNLVGLMRMDSRMQFHRQGPMYWFMVLQALGSSLKPRKGPVPDFFEKIAEIGLPIQDKLLGSLLVATKLQTTMGPNAHLMEVGGMGFFKSYVDEPETGLVISSNDMVAADAVAYAFLAERYKHTPLGSRLVQKLLVAVNGQIKELGKRGVYGDRVMAHALSIGLGDLVASLETYGVPDDLRDALRRAVVIGK